MILACRWAQKSSIMAEKPRFRRHTVFAKNLGFGVGFGYHNNTTSLYWMGVWIQEVGVGLQKFVKCQHPYRCCVILILDTCTVIGMINVCFCLCHQSHCWALVICFNCICMHAVVCFDDRKIMVMPRTSMNTPDKHGQKNLGFFLQCNGETDSQLVSFIHARVVYELGVVYSSLWCTIHRHVTV